MESKEVVGDWQEACTCIWQRSAHLLQSGLWADCVFLVGAGRERVHAHKLLLAIASPVFERMFYGALAAGGESGPIEIPDLKPESFKALLKYIYTDRTDSFSFKDACDLYYAARKYLLPHLAKRCLENLSSHMAPQYACRGYELAQLFDLADIKRDTLEVMRTQTKAVLASDGFIEAQLSTVVQLFSLEELAVDSELQLLSAAERYARAQGAELVQQDSGVEDEVSRTVAQLFSLKELVLDSELQLLSAVERYARAQGAGLVQLDSGAKDEKENIKSCADNDNGTQEAVSPSKPKRRRAQKRNRDSTDEATPDLQISNQNVKPTTLSIRDALRYIRFLTLTAQQFATGATRSTLLGAGDVSAILASISSDVDAAMPAGFSTSRQPRTKPKETGTFEFTVNVKEIKDTNDFVDSDSCYIRDLPWTIRVGPNPCNDDCLTICVVCEDPNGYNGWFCPASGTLRLLRHKPDAEPLTWDFKEEFCGPEGDAGYIEENVEWSEVLDPENGFLKDGSITVEVDLCVGELCFYTSSGKQLSAADVINCETDSTEPECEGWSEFSSD